MNGTDFDVSLARLGEARLLANTDIPSFCQTALGNANFYFNGYGTKLFQDQLKELRDSVNNDTYDNVAVEIASTIMNHIYDEYDKKLNSKISKYNNSVNRAIANNRIKGILLRIIQKLLQLVIVAGATALPFILNYPGIPNQVTTAVSIAVAVSAALVTFFKFGDHISYFQRSAEDLQREYNLHQSSRKHYTTLLRGAALDLFMDRIDELRQEQHKLSLELEKTVRDQEQKIGELTKAIRIKSMPTQEQ